MSAHESSTERHQPGSAGAGGRDSLAAVVAEARRAGFDDAELEELLEFCAPGQPVPLADPVFKARLRLDLWWMLQCRRATGQRRTDPR